MNILITGAFGFVGTNLSKALSTKFKHHLIAVDVSEPEHHNYSEYIAWDELHTIGHKKIDAIIHLAGKAHDTRNAAAEQEYFDINLGLTQRIFEFFLQSGATKFIFFSSVKAVADSIKGEQLFEDELPEPQTPYGKSKLAAEQYIQNLLPTSDFRLPTSDKKVYILRPCMIHGPGNKGNLNLLYRMVSKGIPWPLGAFENNRSFLSVDNLSFVISQIIQKEIAPGTYQVADDNPLSTNRLIELIAEAQKQKPRIWKLNKKLVQNFAHTGDIMHLPLNSERLQKLTESYVVSNQKLKMALGIDKMPFDAEEGMKKTLDSFK